MNEKDNSDQSSCCQGGDCCSPTGADSNNHKAYWKTIIFLVVILLACAVAAYSLFWRSDNEIKAAGCAAGSAACAAQCGGTLIITGITKDSVSGVQEQNSTAVPACCAPGQNQKKVSDTDAVDRTGP